ncbi:MAG TPA: L,D-transpeptidase family protein, partial [Flavitalea sp.]|nr:L,D-transpeptidase family protein [Flavitalea sp.]
SITQTGGRIEAFEPVNRQYGLLRTYLVRYNNIVKNGDWQDIQADKKKYVRGDSTPVVAIIRKRLQLLGDLEGNKPSMLFDDSLQSAVKRFQQRYGLSADGVVGGKTLLEMNAPLSGRIRQLLVNMERMKWVPAEPSGDFLFVNIPEFTLHGYENGKHKFKMNVVVGSTQNHTVIFTGKLKYVVFSPFWNVPASILKNEIIPGIKRNPNYLAQHNMEWNGGAVRQKPGPRNSLGLVKFLFPNSYDIYLHDTPSKSLFNESIRAFSHGCIRVSQPANLAQWILRSQPGWTTESINKSMHANKEKFVTVKSDINVFIGYFTAFVDQEGRLNFRDDIYGHDKEMEEKMFLK